MIIMILGMSIISSVGAALNLWSGITVVLLIELVDLFLRCACCTTVFRKTSNVWRKECGTIHSPKVKEIDKQRGDLEANENNRNAQSGKHTSVDNSSFNGPTTLNGSVFGFGSYQHPHEYDNGANNDTKI